LKKSFLIALILSCIAESCQNYDEGPWISFRRPVKKIHGTYLLEKYEVNGIDSMDLYLDSLAADYNFFYSGLNQKEVFRITGKRKDGKPIDIECKYELTHDNKIMKVVSTSGLTGTGPIGGSKIPEWDILRLTNKEMKLKTNYNNNEYVISLNKSTIIVI
jgi:hypothetical protein